MALSLKIRPMSITPKTLSAIQKAGEAIDTARQVLAAAVTDHAARVMNAIKHNPTNPDNESSLDAWKALTQLARHVESAEQQFRSIYFTAEKLVMPEVQVLPALGHQKAAPKALPATSEPQVQDVIAKPSIKKTRKPKVSGSVPAAPVAAASTPAAPSTGKISKNDQKVLSHLAAVLTSSSWTRLTQQSIAQGSGIPNGSVAASLNRLIAAKKLAVDPQGQYRLAK